MTGTHIAYLLTCHRKLWLFCNGIHLEHTSGLVAEGKLINETTYPNRAGKYTEIEIDGVKIDFFDARSKVVHEVKKSSRMEKVHIAQVKYYLYKLEQKGIEGATAVIEYPKLKQRVKVEALTDEDRTAIHQWEIDIEMIKRKMECPP
ncbi:MAG: CRISPR-associated protein Cas4, partial [Candidatus Diapherotrites archaeon]